MAVPPSALEIDMAAGTASFKLTNYEIPDWIDFAQSLAQVVSFPAVVSFDLRFLEPGPRYMLRREDQQFVYDFRTTKSTITWSSSQDSPTGFSFVSDPADPSKSLFASLGYERNGVFFNAPAGAPTTTTTRPSAVAAQRPVLPVTGVTDRRGAIVGAAALGAAVLLRRRLPLVEPQRFDDL